MTFSQDFEREADYVGMYLLARSGRQVAGAAGFWRRMAQESPGEERPEAVSWRRAASHDHSSPGADWASVLEAAVTSMAEWMRSEV
jgi:hypothetical protein